MSSYRFAFVSYSRDDYDFVVEIVKFLEQSGVKVYIDKRDIPPGADFADSIVAAIESAVCCILVFTDSSNKSQYVFREMNSAVNHNKRIIPIRINGVTPSRTIEFYIGTNNWIDFKDLSSLNILIDEFNKICSENRPTQQATEKDYKVTGPTVMRSDQLSLIGYSVEKKVIETIEIDYKTLGDSPIDYEIDEEKEGTLADWVDYAHDFPETSSMLIVNDRIVGYYQFELLNDINYSNVVSGTQMISSDMEELYGFGGEFCCYIAIMPILREYETQKNYMLLLEDFFQKMVEFADDGVEITKYAISVYTPLLKKIMSTLGFKEVGENPVGGTIMELLREDIINNSIFQKKYPFFYKLNGGIIDDV
jgi:hypothetical protein